MLSVPLILCGIGLSASFEPVDSSISGATCGRIPLGMLLVVISHAIMLCGCCMSMLLASFHCCTAGHGLADTGDDATDCACAIAEAAGACLCLGGAVTLLFIGGLFCVAALICLTVFFSQSHATCGGATVVVAEGSMYYEWAYIAATIILGCVWWCIPARRGPRKQ